MRNLLNAGPNENKTLVFCGEPLDDAMVGDF
jgi:hypothetical protein